MGKLELVLQVVISRSSFLILQRSLCIVCTHRCSFDGMKRKEWCGSSKEG